MERRGRGQEMGEMMSRHAAHTFVRKLLSLIPRGIVGTKQRDIRRARKYLHGLSGPLPSVYKHRGNSNHVNALIFKGFQNFANYEIVPFIYRRQVDMYRRYMSSDRPFIVLHLQCYSFVLSRGRQLWVSSFHRRKLCQRVKR
jgi:hypothetical protein